MTRARVAVAVTAAAACVAVAGVVGVTSASATPVPAAAAPVAAADGTADWTLMIYDVADTENIADEMIRNLAAFAELPDMDNVNVVALVDLPEESEPDYPRSTLPGVAPFTTAKLLVLDDNKWNEVRDLGEVSMGRPDVLAGFIEEAAGEFPATKYGLVLSDHGSGFGGGYADATDPKSHLSVAGLREGILTGMQSAGIDKFELIDHDACLMANYEASSALAPLTEYISASEEATFGAATLSNDAILSLGQNVDGSEWGRINNEGYAAYADGNPQGWGHFTATAVIDADKMATLDVAIQSFADAATAHMSEIAPEVGRARAAALEFVKGIDPSAAGVFDLVDLGDFLRHLQDVPADVAVARDAVFAALDQVVMHQVTRQATEQATGLNVYFPKDTTFADRYVESHLAPPGWEEFVASYLQASGGAGESGGSGGEADQSAQFVNPEASILEQGPDGILIAGQLGDGDADNVTSTDTQVFTTLGGGDALAIDLPGYLNAGAEGQVQGSWSYQVTAIGPGSGEAVPVSSIYQAQSGGLIGTFYAVYQPPGGDPMDVQFRVLLSAEGEIQGVTISEDGSGGSAPVELEGGTLTPYYIVPGNSGYELQAAQQSVPVTEDFQISFPRLAEGASFDIAVVVGDLAGNYDGAIVTSQVPGGGDQGQSSLRLVD